MRKAKLLLGTVAVVGGLTAIAATVTPTAPQGDLCGQGLALVCNGRDALAVHPDCTSMCAGEDGGVLAGNGGAGHDRRSRVLLRARGGV